MSSRRMLTPTPSAARDRERSTFCPAACLRLNHHRTCPVFLFTAIFISSNEARSSSGTSKGKGGMTRGRRGRIPALAAPSLPPESFRGPSNVCCGISFLYPSPTWGGKSKSHPAEAAASFPSGAGALRRAVSPPSTIQNAEVQGMLMPSPCKSLLCHSHLPWDMACLFPMGCGVTISHGMWHACFPRDARDPGAGKAASTGSDSLWEHHSSIQRDS